MRALRFRILIVDSHPIFRQGLRNVISSESDLSVVGEATSGCQVVRMAGDLKPDVVLLDDRMPGSTTAEILAELNKFSRAARAVIMVDEIRQNEVLVALRLGARGLLSKESTPELLLRCIRSVTAGQYWIGRESVVQLVEIFKNPSLAPQRSFGLTERELQVIQAIVDGCTNREIARQFFISQQTVKHHLNKIFDKVGVSSRLELAMFAIHHNLTKWVSEGILDRISSPPPNRSRFRLSSNLSVRNDVR
jgi:two-component system nitrate/nitrite response regulator NarL